MKKICVFVILFALIIVGCSKKNAPKQNLTAWMESEGTLRVLSTTAMIDDVVKQIGGESIRSLCLIVGDLDPHSYELIKGDDEKFQAADLIFYNGVGLEHGASIRYHLEHSEKAISVGGSVYQRHPDRFVTVEGQLDPHIWMDMDLFAEIVDPIVEALVAKDPAHEAGYRERGIQVKQRLKEKDFELQQAMKRVPEEKRYLVTSHDAFHYFTKRYLSPEGSDRWESRVQAPEGLAPDGQMSVFDIQKVTDFLCKNQVHVVFPESNVSRDSLRKIVEVCQKKGLKVEVAQTTLYGDTMAGAETYIEMMEHNVNTLTSYLMGSYDKSVSR